MTTSRLLAAISICLSLLLATPALAANWNTFKREACTGMGTRQYSAQLMNISGSWEAACRSTAPATVQPLDNFNVKWEVNDCKRYSMASGGVVIDQNAFAGAKGQVVKTATLTVPMQTGVWAFTLSGQNASGSESNDEFRTLVACQGSPGGALQIFNFRAQCGSSCTSVSQVACNAASAKSLVDRNFGNCTVVQNGSCR